MEQILYLVLGALLALLGGIVTQRIQNHFNKQKEDIVLLYHALRILLEYKEPASNDIVRELKNIVIKIRSRHFRNLASEIFKWSNIEKESEKKKKLDYLIFNVVEAINKPLVKKEMKDIEDLPETENEETKTDVNS